MKDSDIYFEINKLKKSIENGLEFLQFGHEKLESINIKGSEN